MVDEQLPEKPLPIWERFIGRPSIGFIVGLVGIVATIVTWWYYPTVDPQYRVFPADVVARRESPRLTVEWDGSPIDNLCVAKIALWNAGKEPITHDRLTDSDPLRIVPAKRLSLHTTEQLGATDSVTSPTPGGKTYVHSTEMVIETPRLLAVETANSSRPTLKLNTQIAKSDGGDIVNLAIHGGDAIEKGEGVALRILFTGDCSAKFQVAGRVIGSGGFKPVMPKTYSILSAVLLAICGLLILVVGIFSIDALNSHLKRRSVAHVRLKTAIVAAFGLWIMAFLMNIVQNYSQQLASGPLLNWLPQ